MNADPPQLPPIILWLWTILWPFLGGLGGAIISLGLPWNEALPPHKKLFNVLCGTLIAIFLGPLAVRYALGATVRGDSELVGAIYCAVGICGTSVMARIVRRFQKMADSLPNPLQKDGPDA